MKTKNSITRDFVLSQIDYDKNNGTLSWKPEIKKKQRKWSLEINRLNDRGYINFWLNGYLYSAHRIIFLIENGRMPVFIDHIDGNRINNKIENLREVTKRQNSQNQEMHRKGKLLGTTYQKRDNKWYAKTWFKKKQIFIGSFDTEIQAHKAYMKVIKQIEKGEFKNEN